MEPARHEFSDVCVFPAPLSQVLSSLADCGFRFESEDVTRANWYMELFSPAKCDKGDKDCATKVVAKSFMHRTQPARIWTLFSKRDIKCFKFCCLFPWQFCTVAACRQSWTEGRLSKFALAAWWARDAKCPDVSAVSVCFVPATGCSCWNNQSEGDFSHKIRVLPEQLRIWLQGGAR